MLRLTLAALLVSVPALAGAECPSRADLSDGVSMVRHDPYFSVVMTQTPAGLSEARVMERGGQVEDVSTMYAHALAVTQRISSDSVLALEYSEDPAALDQIRDLESWSSPLTLLIDGAAVAEGEFNARFLRSEQLAVGVCTYDVWVVRTRLVVGDGTPSFFDYFYAPSLGLSLASIRLDETQEPLHGVLYDEISAL